MKNYSLNGIKRSNAVRRTAIAFDVQRHHGAVRRFAVLVAASVALGVVIGFVLPHVSQPVLVLTGGTASVGQAARWLRALPVAQPNSASGYDRDSFAFRATDDDGNGCDVRDDVLARDLHDVAFAADGCTVISGTLDDPYTGSVIRFHRGTTTSSAVQIDHVVALRNAWISGADQWDSARRIAYANAPANLLAVQGEANQEKSDASADHWLPPSRDFQCPYVALQVSIKYTWHLSVTHSEKEAMGRVLAQCPGAEAPDLGGAQGVSTVLLVPLGVQASPCSCTVCRMRRLDEP